jgi:hypothetical protein
VSAEGALRSRRTWLLIAALLCAALAGAAGWRLWHYWQTAWSMPLSTPLAAIDFPPQVFNEDGGLRPAYNRAAVRLSFLALLSVLITVFVRSWIDDHVRSLVGIVGTACTAMILLVAWAMQSDAQINGNVRKLADKGSFAELESLTKRKPDLPYARYIGAQALLLSGNGSQLRREYGPWLQDWGRQAATSGYMRPGMTGKELQSWPGMSASPRVMRWLELQAFGRGVSVFSRDYEATVRQDMATAEVQAPYVAGAFALFALLAALAASGARMLGRKIEDLERRGRA